MKQFYLHNILEIYSIFDFCNMCAVVNCDSVGGCNNDRATFPSANVCNSFCFLGFMFFLSFWIVYRHNSFTDSHAPRATYCHSFKQRQNMWKKRKHSNCLRYCRKVYGKMAYIAELCDPNILSMVLEAHVRVCVRVCAKSFDQLTISKCNFAHCQAAHMPHADIPRKIVEQPIRTANICFLHTVNWCSSLCLTIGIYEITTSKVVGFFFQSFLSMMAHIDNIQIVLWSLLITFQVYSSFRIYFVAVHQFVWIARDRQK